MTTANQFVEYLLETYFSNFRSLYASQYDAQMALSRAVYTMLTSVETSETFIVVDTMPERLYEVVNNSDNYLKAAKMTSSIDGVWIYCQLQPFKLLRVV